MPRRVFTQSAEAAAANDGNSSIFGAVLQWAAMLPVCSRPEERNSRREEKPTLFCGEGAGDKTTAHVFHNEPNLAKQRTTGNKLSHEISAHISLSVCVVFCSTGVSC